jgi:hypothetical protein
VGRQVRARDGWVIDQVEDNDEPLYFLYRRGTVIGPDGYTREALQQASAAVRHEPRRLRGIRS